MKPASKQESIVMVKETFIPRSTKSQTILFFLLLVLVSLAFAAGVLLGPRISPSRCGIRSQDDDIRSARNERSSSVCITKDDLIIFVATLKPSLQNAPQGPSSFKTKFVTREASQSPSTQSPSTTGSSKDLKALIMANLTAHLNRTFVEMLSEKLGECASVGVRHETTRPTVVTTVKSTTTTTTRSTDEEKGSPNPTEAITPTLTGICPGGWKAYSGSCYTMKRAAVDKWETARDLCRMDNSDLVSIASPEENDFVYELARAEAPQFKYMWMGMRRPTPLGSFSWVDDTSRALAYQNWAKGEPNNEQNTGENCVHMYISPDKGREGQWNDEKCANTSNGGPMAYMCKGNPPSKRVNEIGGSGLECGSGSGSGNFLEEMLCPKGWSHFQGSCFKLNSAAPTQNWDQANLACQSMFSYLVVIDSREENQFVYQLARATAPNYKYMWIGLHRSSSLDAFRWSEFNTAPAYHNWAKGEPNNDRNNGENCVHMYLTSFKGKQTQWNDERCLSPGNGGPMVYMCERPDLASVPSGLITTTESGSENFNQNEIDFRDDDIWYEN